VKKWRVVPGSEGNEGPLNLSSSVAYAEQAELGVTWDGPF
jgi:hypothetical protein